jgi:saposin
VPRLLLKGHKSLCPGSIHCYQLKIIEILLKGCNNAENFVQKCKRLIIQNAPIIMEHIKKFLKKRDFCNSIHVCGGKSVHAGAQALRSLSSV